MRHADHESRTREDCEECTALAYEPGWYKALRDERVVAKDRSVVSVPEPDAAEVDVVIAEPAETRVRRRRS